MPSWVHPCAPRTAEHFFTTDEREYAVLGAHGWTQEGIAYMVFVAAGNDGVERVALNRLLDTSRQLHHWTSDAFEVSVLSGTANWKDEGTVGYVETHADASNVPLYRLRLASPPLHLWSVDSGEVAALVAQGWVNEGVMGYVRR